MNRIKEIAIILSCLIVSTSFNYPLLVKLVEAQSSENQPDNSIYYCTTPIREVGGGATHYFVFVKKDSGKDVELEATLSNVGPGPPSPRLLPGNLENLFPGLKVQVDSSSGKMTITGTTAFIINTGPTINHLELKLTKGDISLVGVDDCVALTGSSFYSYEAGKRAYVREKIDPIGQLVQLGGLLVGGLLNIKGGTGASSTIVLGDVHGWYLEAMKQLSAAGTVIENGGTVDTLKDYDVVPGRKIIFLGDSIDRAPSATEQIRTLHWFSKWTRQGAIEYIGGNHDLAALQFYMVEQYKLGRSDFKMYKWYADLYDQGIDLLGRGSVRNGPGVEDVMSQLFYLAKDGKIDLAYAQDNILHVHAGLTDKLWQYIVRESGKSEGQVTAEDAATILNKLMKKWIDGIATTDDLDLIRDAIWTRTDAQPYDLPNGVHKVIGSIKTDPPFEVKVGHTSKSSSLVSNWQTVVDFFKNKFKRNGKVTLVGDDIREIRDGGGNVINADWRKSTFGIEALVSKLPATTVKELEEIKTQLRLIDEDNVFFKNVQKIVEGSGSLAQKITKLEDLAKVILDQAAAERARCGSNCPQGILDLLKAREDLGNSLKDASAFLKNGDTKSGITTLERIFGDFNDKLTDNTLKRLKRASDIGKSAKDDYLLTIAEEERNKIRGSVETFNKGAADINAIHTNRFSQRVPEILATDSAARDQLRTGVKELGSRKIGNYLMGAAFAALLIEPIISDLGERMNNSFLITVGLGIRYVGLALLVASGVVILAQIVAYVVFQQVLTGFIIEMLGVTSIEVFLGWTIVGFILPMIINQVYCYLINYESAMCGCNFKIAKYTFTPNPVKPDTLVKFVLENSRFCDGKKLVFYTPDIPGIDPSPRVLAPCNVLADGSCLGERNSPKDEKEYSVYIAEPHESKDSVFPHYTIITNTNQKLYVSSNTTVLPLQCQKENDKSWLCKAGETSTVQCTQDTSASKLTWKCKITG